MPINLTQSDIDELRNAKRIAEEAITDLDKAERAGLDVKDQKEKLNKQLSQINQILSVYS
jgi:uncharacterized protein YgfB (UPF0149 family)